MAPPSETSISKGRNRGFGARKWKSSQTSLAVCIRKRPGDEWSGPRADLPVQARVDLLVIKVKCPLEDIECYSTTSGMSGERTVRPLSSLKKIMEAIRETVKVWVRIVPGMITMGSIERMGKT